MPTTISSNVDHATAAKLRTVAASENRSVSNVVASAVAVFTDLPKGVRDLLLELHSRNDEAAIRLLGREMMVAAARVQLERTTTDLAPDRLFGGPDADASEIEVMEEATRLSKEAARK